MGLKELTPESLENAQKVLALFEFYGITEDMIKSLPAIIALVNEHEEYIKSFLVSKENEKKEKSKKDFDDIIRGFAPDEDLKDE